MSTNFYELESQTGHFISADHRRIAEIINDYNQYMQLIWIPPEQRELNEEFPFAILHSPPGLAPYIVRKVRESEMNHTLISWLAMNDLSKNRPADIFARIEADEAARKLLEFKRQEEAKAEKLDLAKSIIGGKNFYKHDGKKYT